LKKRTQRSVLGGAVALAMLAAVAGCSAEGTAGGGNSNDQDTSAQCGQVPKLETTGSADLSGLPQEIQDAYAGYFQDVDASEYQEFVSPKSDGFVIGYSDSFSANSWRSIVLDRLNEDVAALKESGVVSDFIATNSNLDNNLQIQQITSMIDQKVDAIIAIPGSPTAFDSVIKQAYDAGIPFITMASHVDSPYAINVDSNYFLTGVKMATGVSELINMKGSVLIVDGINGSPASGALHDGYQAGFANCPDIKVAGAIEGQWSEAVTKTAMLQYLATNPAPIDGIVNGGGETIGIVQALQQSGRDLVPIGDSNPDKGGLVLLKESLADKYVAGSLPPVPMADAGLQIAIATLRGFQPKYDAIVGLPPYVTGSDSLDKWIDPSWTADDANQAPAPPGSEFLTASILSNYFAKPGEFVILPPQ
jgi:ribose transport system substrate-binding protein